MHSSSRKFHARPSAMGTTPSHDVGHIFARVERNIGDQATVTDAIRWLVNSCATTIVRCVLIVIALLAAVYLLLVLVSVMAAYESIPWVPLGCRCRPETGAKTMRALRVVSRIVTGVYFLSFVCLLLTTHALREMAGIASYAFLVMLAVSVLMSAIKWRCRRAGRDEP